jgi:chromosomal replication initiator protein
MDHTTVWDEVLARIETKVNRHSYYTWFKPTSFLSDSGDVIRVLVPNVLFKDWLTKHYSSVLAEAAAEINRPAVVIAFVADERAEVPPPTAAAATLVPASSAEPPLEAPPDDAASGSLVAGVGLNPRYSFESFVEGPSNQFAKAACLAVAEAPSRAYNPLFIYGGVGLGKTHLMHAIGHYVVVHLRTLKLTYISAERFMNGTGRSTCS